MHLVGKKKINKKLIMKRLLFILLAFTILGTIKAQNTVTISAGKEPKLTGAEGLYALWYKNKVNENEFLEQPYMIGGQMVFQWKELAPEKNKFDFSKIAEELAKFGRKKMYTTIQINGNIKPEWLYEEVPYHPLKFSEQIRDPKGSIMYWHPTHRDAYINMLKAFADFLKTNENRKYLIGIRQNFNGFGTEHLTVKPTELDLKQWIIPEKNDQSIEIKQWTRQLKNEYEEYVLDNYIKLFDGVINVFVRNTINESLEAKYKKQFLTGKLCWFHTSSEAEPHSSDVERQYRIFYEDCRSGKTLAFAEPWASAWGHHGKRDDRWCSPPKWFYWTLLLNLHSGVSFIGLYSSDMQVAIDGTYKSGDVDYKDGEKGTYKKEFTDAILFAKKYVGFHDKPKISPGAWVAFRENDSILANNNQSVNGHKLSFITSDYNFLMERLSDKSYGKNIKNVGPDDQRFGAWARVLPAKEQMNFRINQLFLESAKSKSISVSITYYDIKGKDFNVTINNTNHLVKCEGQDKWITKVIQIKDGMLKANDKNAHITIQNGAENIYLHMVEVTR